MTMKLVPIVDSSDKWLKHFMDMSEGKLRRGKSYLLGSQNGYGNSADFLMDKVAEANDSFTRNIDGSRMTYGQSNVTPGITIVSPIEQAVDQAEEQLKRKREMSLANNKRKRSLSYCPPVKKRKREIKPKTKKKANKVKEKKKPKKSAIKKKKDKKIPTTKRKQVKKRKKKAIKKNVSKKKSQNIKSQSTKKKQKGKQQKKKKTS